MGGGQGAAHTTARGLVIAHNYGTAVDQHVTIYRIADFASKIEEAGPGCVDSVFDMRLCAAHTLLD
jgi:hypothetical protein